MNSSPAEAFSWLTSLSLPPVPPHIRAVLCSLYERAHTVTRLLAPQLRPSASVGSRDFVFRVLEVQEYLIVSRILHALTSRRLAHSVFWLHDGFWVSPAPDFSLLQDVTRQALRSYGFHDEGVFLRAECLQDKYRSLINDVANTRCSSPLLFAALRTVKVKPWAKHTVVFGRGRQLTHAGGVHKHSARKQKRTRFARKFATCVRRHVFK